MARLPGTRSLLALAFLFGMSPRTTSAGVAAAHGVMVSEFGKNMPAIVLEEDSTLLLRYADAQEYIDEVGESRILFGVHYRFSVDVGKEMGVSIGKLAVERYFKPLKSSSSRK